MGLHRVIDICTVLAHSTACIHRASVSSVCLVVYWFGFRCFNFVSDIGRSAAVGGLTYYWTISRVFIQFSKMANRKHLFTV